MHTQIGRALLRRLFTLSAVAALATAASLTLTVQGASAGSISAKERKCLATAVYFEARGETERGQKGVAQVILNRVEDDAYPNTICGVVYQNKHRRNACQFSFACDGTAEITSEKRAWERAQAVAEDVLEGNNLIAEIRSATHYHADYVTPYWAPKMKRLSSIGRHIFYQG